MSANQPIGVAFVEVRPEVDDFRSNAEADLAALTGDQALQVKGNFKLDGLTDAKRDVANLTREVEGVAGAAGQLQFQGLTQAAGEADNLTASLQGAADVDIAASLTPAADAAAALAQNAETAAAATAAIPGNVNVQFGGIDDATSDIAAMREQVEATINDLAVQTSPEFAQGFVAGAEEAITAAVEFGDATEDVNQNLITAEAARRQLAGANLVAAASENNLAGATRGEAAAAFEADAAERQLIRTRARRSSSLGPLRLAGVGLGAGVALFAATQALRELGDQLRVTGNEADTGLGKVRNFGAEMLSGNIIGAFKALGDQARSYSTEAVLAIDRSEELAAGLKKAGIALNEIKGLSESREVAAGALTQVPQFLQTRIAQTKAGGDTEGQLQALEQAQDALHRQEQAIRDLNLDQAQTNAALEGVFNEQANIAGQIDTLTKQARPDILAPLVEAVTDARLSGDSAAILAALKSEAAQLEKVINAEKTNAADRRRFKDQLLQVNQDIESTQDAIVAETQRHQQAMLDKLLDIGVLEDLESQAAGTDSNAGRARRAAAIQATLDRGTLNGKKLTRAQKEQLNAELVAINNAIESEQEAINNEEKRHASEMERLASEHDQTVLDSLEGPQRRGRNRALAAAATAQLNDDIRASENLQRIYRQQIAVARKRIRDRKLRDATIDSLEDEIAAEERNERTLRQQNRREAVDRRGEALDLNIELAQANENVGGEIRAHRAKIAFLTERLKHTRARTNQRKQLRVAIAQERAEIRRLKEEESGGEGADFNEIAFSFLQELQGFSSNLASNVLPGNFQLQPVEDRSGRFTRPNTRTVGGLPARPPTAGTATTSPFTGRDPGTGGPFPGGDRPDAARAAELRGGGGTQPTAGQLETLIHIGRNTNRLLGDLKRGVGHPEARTARELNKHRGGTVSVD